MGEEKQRTEAEWRIGKGLGYVTLGRRLRESLPKEQAKGCVCPRIALEDVKTSLQRR